MFAVATTIVALQQTQETKSNQQQQTAIEAAEARPHKSAADVDSSRFVPLLPPKLYNMKDNVL